MKRSTLSGNTIDADASAEGIAGPRQLSRRAGLLLLLASIGSGCGYRVGGAYAPEIRTVHIPTFQNDTFRRGIELQLTEAVQKQLQLRTPYRLAKGPNADTRLVGRLVSANKRVENQNRYDDPRELELAIAVEVRWEDARTGYVLSERSIPVESSVAQLITHSSFAPETGQSLATGTQQAVDQMARQIVGMMEIPW
ncbi:LPS assembly lipoprotein LptE [Maioricimonas rarisocia]|nr:LptE family protein [Maioricimonas rarisocia]